MGPPTRSPEKVSGSFENGSLWRQERWEYEVRKMHASRAPYSPTVGVEPIVNASELGHEIIAKKHSARYCSCSVNPLNNIMDIMSSAAPTEELDREARSLNQVSPPSKAQAKPASVRSTPSRRSVWWAAHQDRKRATEDARDVSRFLHHGVLSNQRLSRN